MDARKPTPRTELELIQLGPDFPLPAPSRNSQFLLCGIEGALCQNLGAARTQGPVAPLGASPPSARPFWLLTGTPIEERPSSQSVPCWMAIRPPT